jgi:hypothetical protein
VRTLNCPLFESAIVCFRVSDSAGSEREQVPTFSFADLSGTATGMFFFAFLGADLKLSVFSKSANGNHTIGAATFPRLEALEPLLRIPGSRNWLGFSFSRVRTLNCPLFESVEIEHAKKP